MRAPKIFGFWSNPFENKKVKAAIIAIAVALAVISLICVIAKGAVWVAVTLLPFFVLLALVFWGQFSELLGTVILMLVIYFIGPEVQTVTTIWVDSPKMNQTIFLLKGMGYFNAGMVIFFFLSVIDVLTCAFKFFRAKIVN